MKWKHAWLVMCLMAIPFLLCAQSERLKLFIDCRTDCDESYFRQELNYVDHVRDIRLSDVHILVTSFSAGNGGRTYTLQFNGRKAYQDEVIELEYSALPNSPRDEVRSGMLKRMNAGLMPFIIEAGQVDDVTIDIVSASGSDDEEEVDPFSPMLDPWRFWVFEISLDGNLELESIRRRFEFESQVEANHVTEDWKVRQSFYYERRRTTFIQDEDNDIVADLYSYGSYGQVVKSISDHWSVGVSHWVNSSVFDNIGFGARLGPAIEYSFWPYNEVNYRELVFSYSLRQYYREYNEETVFFKNSEYLTDQSVRIALRLRRPWGSVFSSLEGRHFFHDFQRNSLEFRNRISWRVFQGFALSLRCNFELINDQISLPRGEATLEELLLEQQQRSTNYEIFLGVGVNYTFGSIYNNIVNTRL